LLLVFLSLLDIRITGSDIEVSPFSANGAIAFADIELILFERPGGLDVIRAEAPLFSRKSRKFLVECRIYLRNQNDPKFRYVQTQRRARAPIIDESISVRDIDGSKILAKVQKLLVMNGSERLRCDVHAEANAIMAKPPRSGRRAKRRKYLGRNTSR
jgi:hypothetical protein